MKWLREHGVISDIWQYQNLDERVLDDCRLLIELENMAAKAKR